MSPEPRKPGLDLPAAKGTGQEPTTWTPVDLTAALAGTDIEPPLVLTRTDGMALLYAGRVHSFQGESESLKSWAAQLATAQVLNAGRDVLYIDYEDDERGVVSRLLALGVSSEAIADHLVYIRPDEPLMDRQLRPTQGLADLGTILESRTFALAIVDGVTEAMVTEGLNPIDNADVAYWQRRLPRRLAKAGPGQIGPPTGVIDHLPKDRQTQGRYALGGQHKLAGLSGAAYKFVLVQPLRRARGIEEVEGVAMITVEKDRPGYVRGVAEDGKVATLRITAYPDGGVTAALEPPSGHAEIDYGLVAKAIEHLALYDGSAKGALEKAMGGRAETAREALAWMAGDELLRIEKSGNAHLHYLTEKGRLWTGRDSCSSNHTRDPSTVPSSRPIGTRGTRDETFDNPSGTRRDETGRVDETEDYEPF